VLLDFENFIGELSLMLREEIEKNVVILETLESTFITYSRGSVVYQQFYSTFLKVVPKELIQSGWDIIKEYFSQRLPKLLSSPYAGYWFYCVDLAYRAIDRNYQLVTEFLRRLNRVYTLIHINSLVFKFIPHHFDPETWNKAVISSKVKYLKMGHEFVADVFSKSLTKRLEEKYFNMGRRGLIKAYFELRHRVAQMIKHVITTYYVLARVKQSKTSVSNEQYVSRSLIFLHQLSLSPPEIQEDFVSQLHECEAITRKFIENFSNINQQSLEFVVRNIVQGVSDVSFYLNNITFKEVVDSIQEELSPEVVECIIEIIKRSIR